MITVFSAVILGIIEGITEFLPISSTAHLILAVDLMKIGEAATTKTFEIAIQSGAILAVVVLYGKHFFNLEKLKKIICAFIPTGVIGFLLYKIVKTYFLGNTTIVLAALALGGALLILFEKIFQGGNSGRQDISYRDAFVIGICQSLAIVPGVSRSAATIVGGLGLGISRESIVEFSFLLAVPTLLAATGLDLFKNIHAFSGSDIRMLMIGSTAAFITALVSIKYFLSYIRQHSFVSFGVYRIVIAALFFFFVF